MKPIYVLTVVLAIATLYFYQDPGWNGNSRLDAVKAVVERGTFEIDAYHLRPAWHTMDESVYGGHYYTDKAIGSSLLGLPVYFAIYRLAAALGLALSSVFTKHVLTLVVVGSSFVILGLVMYLIALKLTQQLWKAALVALAIALGTMLWPYSAVYYGHVPAAMFVALAFYLLLTARQAQEARIFAAAGLMMGLAFITEYPTALIIAGLAVYALYQTRGRPTLQVLRAGAAAFAGAAAPLLIMLLYNRAVYGSLLVSGYSHVAIPAYQAGLEKGYMGVSLPKLDALYHFTLDPQFGIFWQSPVLLLGAAGIIEALRRKAWRAELLLAVYSIAAMFLMNAGYFMWWGGASFAARYVIPGLPFFAVLLALLPDSLTGLLGGLTVLSALQMLVPLLGTIQPDLRFDAGSGHFSLGVTPAPFMILQQYGLPLIFQLRQSGLSPWTLGSALGLPLEASAGLFVGIEAALTLYLKRQSTQDPAELARRTNRTF